MPMLARKRILFGYKYRLEFPNLDHHNYNFDVITKNLNIDPVTGYISFKIYFKYM